MSSIDRATVESGQSNSITWCSCRRCALVNRRALEIVPLVAAALGSAGVVPQVWVPGGGGVSGGMRHDGGPCPPAPPLCTLFPAQQPTPLRYPVGIYGM